MRDNLKTILRDREQAFGLPSLVVTIKDDKVMQCYRGFDEVSDLTSGKFLQSAQRPKRVHDLGDVVLVFMGSDS